MTDSETAVVPTNQGIAKRKSQAVLVQQGNHLVPSDRQFHAKLAAEYIRDFGRTRWITISELARTFFGRDCQSNRIKMRQRMHLIFRVMVNSGIPLVIEYSAQGAQACKVFDPQSEVERQAVRVQLGRIEKQKLHKVEQHHRFLVLIECSDTTPES